MTVLVVTPTIGTDHLITAIESVASQKSDFPVRHLLVVDGAEFEESVHKIVHNSGREVDLLVLPYNTGRSGFYGHRVLAAVGHLLPEDVDYVLFLDEDNWYLPSHVQTLVETARFNRYDFSFSLRSYYSPSGEYLLEDNHASLGDWSVYADGGFFETRLVDTSAYCFERSYLEKHSHVWHSGIGADRSFFNTVRAFSRYGCSGYRTLCYRLSEDNLADSLKYIEAGNALSVAKYGSPPPWVQ